MSLRGGLFKVDLSTVEPELLSMLLSKLELVWLDNPEYEIEQAIFEAIKREPKQIDKICNE